MGAVARDGGGDRLADPARGAGDQHDLALQRAVPVLGEGGLALPDADHLARHVGRLGPEQEAQGGLGVALGAGLDVHQLHRRAVADLLAQRAGEALQRALGGGLAGARAVLGRGAQHHHPAVGLQAADDRVEELVQRPEALRAVDAGGVVDDRAELAVIGGGVEHLGPDGAHDGVQRLAEAAGGGRPDQRRAVQHGLAGLEAPQPRRLGEAELLGEEAPGTREH